MITLKIAVATHYAPNFKSVGEICDKNREEYCNTHGYSYERKFGELVHYCYDKYSFVLSLLIDKGYDYIWWTDADGLITNFNKKIEDYIESKKDFVISKDVLGFNDGSFFIKKSETSIKFLIKILQVKSIYASRLHQAQEFFNEKYSDLTNDIIDIVKQKDINSYLYDLYGYKNEPKYHSAINDGTWSKGDWFLHFPGTTYQERVQLMKSFGEKVIKTNGEIICI